MSRSYSYSNLQTALKCNRMFKYLVVDKLTPVQEESLELHFGTALHAGLTSLLEGADAGAFSAYWASVKGMQFAKGRHTWDELAEMGELFLDRFTRLHLKHLKPFITEQRLFALSPGGIKLEGTPDFVGTYKGIPTVLDFKTSASRYGKERILCSDQLVLYAHLAQQHIGAPIKQISYIVFVKGKEPSIQTLSLDLTQEFIHERLANIELQCNELEAKQTYHQNFNSCVIGGRRCGFWKQCHGDAE